MAREVDRRVAREATGPELFALVRRRLIRAAVLANGVGGLAVFACGLFVPITPSEENLVLFGVLNVVALVLLMAFGFPIGLRWIARLARPLERWSHEERAATPEEQALALRLPWLVVQRSLLLWGVAALVFTALNSLDSRELAASSFGGATLGAAACCTLLYLLAERATRPLVARALAGGPPPHRIGPSVAARLTIAWTLVTGVPLLTIAGILTADLVDAAAIDSLATLGMLLLALAALAGGFAAMRLAARSVAEPVRDVEEAMATVEDGHFEARVPVDDGSEIGRLQAGFNRMAAGLAERERVRDLFGRQVGRDVARAALEGDLKLGGEEREVAVLFVDIVGSTALAARRPPTEVVTLLNGFFDIVVNVAQEHGGWVNKFEGDAALCVFGAPVELEDPAGAALAAGRELHERLARELPQLQAGIGVSAGTAVAGNVGAEERFEYTVIGDPVNEAARLCELAKQHPGRLLASDAAVARTARAEAARWTLGDEVTLRGRAAPTRLASPA